MRLTESQLRTVIRRFLVEQEEQAEAGASMSASDVSNTSDLKKYFLSLSKSVDMPGAQASRIAALVDKLLVGGAAGEFSSSEVELIDKGLAKVAQSTE